MDTRGNYSKKFDSECQLSSREAGQQYLIDRLSTARTNGMDSSSTLRHRNVPDWIMYSSSENHSHGKRRSPL